MAFGSRPRAAGSAGSRPGRTHPRPVRRQVVDPIRRSGAADFFGDHKCGSTTTRPRARARHHDPHSAGRDRHPGGAGGRRAGRDAERSGTDRCAPGSCGAPGGTGAYDGGRCGAQGGSDDRGHAPWRDRPGRLSRRHVDPRYGSPSERSVQGAWMLSMAAGPVARCRRWRWARSDSGRLSRCCRWISGLPASPVAFDQHRIAFVRRCFPRSEREYDSRHRATQRPQSAPGTSSSVVSRRAHQAAPSVPAACPNQGNAAGNQGNPWGPDSVL